jgi:DNA polymerase-3 subunit alpha
VIVYQEQVMQIAQVLAGYTMGDADILRRAMGKKDPEEMAAQRERFVDGAKKKKSMKKKPPKFSIRWRPSRVTASTSLIPQRTR